MTNACSGRGPALVLVANTRGARIISSDAITTGSVGIQVALDLSEEYSGLAVTVVFRAGEEQADWAVIGSEPVMVPPQCLQEPGVMLYIGVYASDGDGNKVIPTVWASAGAVRQGVEPSGYDPVGPAPSWAAQVQQAAADAVETANSVRADAEAGAFDGEDGYSPTATVEQLADGATISITDKDGTTTATIHDGADGATGPEGPAGYSPSVRVTQSASGATITVTDQSGTTTADISNGAPGEPGQTGPIGPTGADGFSPTVDVQPITGGHEVTITDADGPHSFDVMDGDPAEPGSITDELLAPDGIKPQVAQMWGNQLTGTMSGTIDTASDAYAAPPMALSVEGTSTQAGTPTPDAPVPILSVDDLSLVLAGKNLLDEANNIVRGYFYANTGKIESSGTSIYAPVTENTAYTVSGGNGNRRIMAFTKSLPLVNTPIFGGMSAPDTYSAYTFTTPAGSKYVVFYVDASSTMTPSGYQLELGSTATAYEPYQGTTVHDLLPVGTSLRSLPDGTKDELHLSYLRPSTREGWAWYSRELVQALSTVTLDGSEAWKRALAAPRRMYTDSNATNSKFDDIAIAGSDSNPNNVAVLCDHFVYGGSYTHPSQQYGVTVGGKSSYTSLCFDWRNIATDMTVADWEAWLAENPIIVQYPLATPVTTQLDPIELPTLPAPNATVWCDGGSATPSYTMQYVRDTNLVVQQLTAETAIAYASIAAQDGPTATASHAIGTYLTMGGTLFKVTRAIAVGETIAAGTNVTATTVMAELLARTA